MAGDSDFSTTATPTLQQLATFLADEIYGVERLKRLQHVMRNAHAEGATVAQGAVVEGAILAATTPEHTKGIFEKILGGASAWILSLVVEQAFGVDVDNVAFAQLGATQSRNVVAKHITAKMVQGLTGGSTSTEPSAQPAANYLAVVVGQAFESWALGAMAEIVTGVVPILEQVQLVGDLSPKLVGALGISDSSSRVLRPYIDTLVVEPLRRQLRHTYRPELLSEGLAVRQFLRGNWTRAQLDEELARQGWSPDRIEAHLNAAQHFLSLDDALELKRGGTWDAAKVVDQLRQQGYAEETAWHTFEADHRKRLTGIWARVLSPALTAYANRDLTTGDLRNILVAIIEDSEERDLWAHVGDLLREFNVKHLSQGQIIACVKAGVLPRAAYRAWLVREGYPADEALALELLLATEIQKDRHVEDLRAEVEAEHLAEQQARAVAAAARQAEVDRRRSLDRRGAVSDLTRAVVRGMIPIARLEEVLVEELDADTVAILVGLAEDDRQRYLDEQQRRADAVQRASQRHIDVGALEQAVLEHVVSPADFRRRLGQLSFDDVDADLLTATLEARLHDLDAAHATRARAESAAANKSIDLARAEHLVRRGVGSLAQYDALLASLGFGDAARAAMLELLRLTIADDAKAAEAHAAAEARLHAKGISLDELRRAVLLGVRTVDDYQRVLVQQEFTADAQVVLMAVLRDDVAAAAAARRRRADVEAARDVTEIPLATVTRAARLGLVSVATYRARLVRAGYSADDLAIEMDLLVAEIADVQAARARRDALEARAAIRGLTLADVERAVKAGAAPLEAYRARAAALGYTPADILTLVDVLESELAARAEAQARHDAIAAELGGRALSLAQLEAAVKAGLKTVDTYRADVVALGYSLEDADLLTALVLSHLDAAIAAGGGA